MYKKNEYEELKLLHRLAVKELAKTGDKLIIWAGGDAPNQQDMLLRQFAQKFPDVPIRITVDLSKYHNIKVYQGLMDGQLIPDVVMLQTMNDFEDWKKMGVLEPFKPQSFNRLKKGYSDTEGAYLGVIMFCFLPQYAKDGLWEIPSDYTDFLNPEFYNRLVLTPPHDDDAILFVYDRILQKHGKQFLMKLAGQTPVFVRGTAAPSILVGRQGFLGNITGYPTTPEQPSVSFIPENDFFVTWSQRAAMFKLTRHKAAARLFLAYLTSYEHQETRGLWSVRDDVLPPSGLMPIEKYNTNPLEFIHWMRDRKNLHELRNEMQDIFGLVQGQSPLTDPDLLRLYYSNL